MNVSAIFMQHRGVSRTLRVFWTSSSTIASTSSLTRAILNASTAECFYYTFLVSAKRASRNVFGRPLRASLFADFACYRPEFAGRMVVPALASLAMGDRNACDYAQASHRELLIRAGALDPSCEVHLDVRLHVILIFLHVLHVNLFTCKDFLHIANLHVNSLIRKWSRSPFSQK